MKTMRIVQAVILVGFVALVSSCGSNRDYHSRSYPPRPQANVSLIISSSPGLVISRHPGGMYYYRDPYGRTYWRGHGNRYYLDRRHMNRSYNSHQQYNDWRRYHNYNRRRR